MFPAEALSGLITPAIIVIMGAVTLLFGRRLFWLTVAIVGFVVGLTLTLSFLEVRPVWLAWLIAIAAGGLGILLAVFLQKLAVSLAGFLMGGYFLVWLLQSFVDLSRWEWLVFIVGGIIGLIVAASLFELALIGLTSLFGAAVIVQVANFRPLFSVALFVILLIIGLAVQAGQLNRSAST